MTDKEDNQTDREICDRVAVEVMEWHWYDGGDHFTSRWLFSSGMNGPSSFRPCGEHADANDTGRVMERMKSLGYFIKMHHSPGHDAYVVCWNTKERRTNHILIEAPDWKRALCLAALEALAAKASEKPND